jgi:hypothetical protein
MCGASFSAAIGKGHVCVCPSHFHVGSAMLSVEVVVVVVAPSTVVTVVVVCTSCQVDGAAVCE